LLTLRARLVMAQRSIVFAFLFAWSIAGCSEWHGVDSAPDAYMVHSIVQPTDASRGSDGGLVSGDAWVAPRDAFIAPDAAASSCAAQDAHEMICSTTLCDGLDSWAWDGERCARIDCGACVGADCASLARMPDACAAEHASCIPQLCRATGGEWLFWAEECGHYHCGEPSPADCLVGMPVCDCGNGRSFDPSRGCFDDPSCPQVDPVPPMALCTSTGGTWTPGICCSTRCGQPCAAACANDACACGPLQVFDSIRGCIDDAACHVAGVDQVCDAQVRCADGLICCERCGGAGCDPVMHCLNPVCSTDPNIDRCGNDRLAP
jgi:hypothetical protein